MMDLTKDRAKLRELYQPQAEEFVIVDVPALPFAVIDGHGSPDEGAGAAIKTLFTAIYPIRRQARQRMGASFVEPPAEMLYWAEDMQDIATGKKDAWNWKVMVTLPVWADDALFQDAVEKAKVHLDNVPTSLRREMLTEGKSAQIMHIGSQEAVPELLRRLYKDFLPQNKLQPAGPYHEIYLDDWSRVAPEKRKIILRQPVRLAD